MKSLATVWPNYCLRYFTGDTLLFRPNNSDEACRFSRNNDWSQLGREQFCQQRRETPAIISGRYCNTYRQQRRLAAVNITCQPSLKLSHLPKNNPQLPAPRGTGFYSIKFGIFEKINDFEGCRGFPQIFLKYLRFHSLRLSSNKCWVCSKVPRSFYMLLQAHSLKSFKIHAPSLMTTTIIFPHSTIPRPLFNLSKSPLITMLTSFSYQKAKRTKPSYLLRYFRSPSHRPAKQCLSLLPYQGW